MVWLMPLPVMLATTLLGHYTGDPVPSWGLVLLYFIAGAHFQLYVRSK